ncbi:MAG: DUF1553 domain-containing protein [Fuerstiella sp.]|nr:DUF1553 domain-containing protein [Fuerstiella sp.]MCP4857847.1 DUF1553 domain-containing protein [Fuerstiella sp.]
MTHFTAASLALLVVPIASLEARAADIQFSRDIRPLLIEKCYACHGPDHAKREGELRVDQESGMYVKRDEPTVVRGKPEQSALYRRLVTDDEDELMPPLDSQKTLTEEQKKLIKDWIAQGAVWQQHWSFTKLSQPAVPEQTEPGFSVNAIDHFTLESMQSAGLTPSPRANRVTLARRLSFDLTGLPPTPAAVDAFVQDKSPNAYEELVDSLMASEHFGERMAIYWLDVARYADSNGFHGDNPRTMWLYRDYVIEAFNSNMPFDLFTKQQLAGDLMPDGGNQALIASAYNRLLQTTQEGGAQANEYYVRYAADRVRNTAGTWLGTTMGCVECHNHKFDPFSLKDFYSMAAFFADIDEPAHAGPPHTKIVSDEQQAQIKTLDEKIASLNEEIKTTTPEALTELRKKQDTTIAALDADVKAATPETSASVKQKRAETIAALEAEIKAATPETLIQAKQKLDETTAQRKKLWDSLPQLIVTKAKGDPRVVRILARGDWMDESGEIVEPAIPEFFGKLDTPGRRANRLDLANWIASPDNPLTPRVFVNRIWMLYFGAGLSKNLSDAGSQGASPTHSDLLNYLSADFVEHGWNVKRLVRQIVLSGTYRQSSLANDEQRQKDPFNRMLARQNRWRLEAEMVRDAALSISGLLVPKIGGPSVKPYQPPGYWMHLKFPNRTWQHDTGENQYRRALYTWWQRTFLHPSLLAFDAPSREECVPQRARSNTPLQALVLLNDPSYVEAARKFAERIVNQGGDSVESRVAFAIRQAVSRTAGDKEVEILGELYEQQLQEYAADKPAAEKLLATGLSPRDSSVELTQLAAWTDVARAVLNLNETITRN